MAQLIKSNGSVVNVTPNNGTDFSLEELKGFVGGYIEIVKLGGGMMIVVDEEGKLKDKPMNIMATSQAWLFGFSEFDHLVGDVLFCKHSEVK